MNPTAVDPTAPPPQPPQPPRSSFSCDRHPDEQFTGFCPSCLCERLTTLDQSSSNTPSSSRRPSSAAATAAAIKSLFSSNSSNKPPPAPKTTSSKSSSFFPELRRTKSFSASKNETLGLFFEPQRKSCDVRVRNTLGSLFTIDDVNKTANKASSSSFQNHSQYSQNSKQCESIVADKPVLEEPENSDDEEFIEPENMEDFASAVNADEDNDNDDDNGDEIIPVPDDHLENLGISLEIEPNNSEIIEEEVANLNNLKSMKDHIDLDTHVKKSSGGGFWAAASVFSKKWQNWRRKQKIKKQNDGENSGTLPVKKPISRRYRETQSEIADYGFGRRSCDTDPRFSLDAGTGRISFDDPRYSFEEPRASWDGYLTGRSFPRMPPMVSVMEDAPAVHVSRSDMQMPVEEPTMMTVNSVNKDEGVPGGSAQTREYYSDCSSRRRKSLDRSSSIRKTAAAVVAEIDELKAVSNAKVSPTTADYFHVAKVLVGERDSRDSTSNSLRNSNSNSLRDECSEALELSNGFRSNGSMLGNVERKESKKSRSWSWKIWGFIHRRSGGNKDEDEGRYSRINGVERSLSESWQDLRNERNADVRGGFNRNVLRSNSSVSWRNSTHIGGSFGSSRKPVVDMNGNGKKKRDEFVLEKNRSARYSPNHFDNGLLRFYLTPMRGSRRGGGQGKIKPNSSHSIARSVLRLY
ncbi:UPF0503 protein At3g09070, chloroplastic-like [Olea europaea var. sylvestris]|uniref:Uncharacterized protein n=1 Tax=Olea europaea subsp. europaea TaxID=158383 RepID=A0A8S0V337_OLEEU|nr:UPF0503 protein At3g09070, chloroplastic-like [Olea europaea var. sylvestris]CAA3027963.1 Hypothetical predicted protein [Olea europaea subsp. europaea]